MSPTHYELLGLSPWCTELEIRRRYRDLSKRYHPDTTLLPAQEAVEQFRLINEAYAVLSNPERRQSYDRAIHFSRFSYQSRSLTASNLSQIDDDGLPSQRPLSGGELFVLLLIGGTFILCLILVILLAWLRGDRLMPDLPVALTPPYYAVATLRNAPLQSPLACD
ncbi:MAG: DnaJ domain-containing protein [Oscillatoriales cyanobacterium SM2_2_1]|nr:DnaJ domain-containing protein [Oscillatoriales cyanobacterium SM2_2_1]